MLGIIVILPLLKYNKRGYIKFKKMKTYSGETIREIKTKYPNIKLTYCRYHGIGDHGLIANYEGEELFFRDDKPMMDRHIKAEKNNFTGFISNVDFSCELFVSGLSLGKTSKYRAEKFLSFRKKGIEVDSNYISSTRHIESFLVSASEKAKNITAINSFVHSIIEGGGELGHKKRNQIRHLAYTKGLEYVESLYL